MSPEPPVEASAAVGPRTVVVGGGLTGAAFVIHAILASRGPQVIDIVEPQPELGRGLAYAAADPQHRINVPSDRLSLFAGDPGHATCWFFEHGLLPDAASTDAAGHHYVARHHYGSYVADVLRRTVESAGPRVKLRHHRARAVATAPLRAGWRVTLDTGQNLAADRLVLAYGHADPALPFPVAPDVADHPGFIAKPLAAQALAAIAPDREVLIVGTGLTMADVLVTLKAAGHGAHITAVSRRGLLSRPQGLFVDACWLGDELPPPRTALDLLRCIRARVRAAADREGWHPVIDAVRRQLPELWAGLPPAERRRIRRHLLPLWEVHRFRASPQAHAAVSGLIVEGRLTIKRARLTGLSTSGGLLVARLRRPGGVVEDYAFNAIVLCTGPAAAPRSNPLIAALLDGGHARLDDLGTGLAVDAASRVLDRDDQPDPSLLALGPMTRGSFGEMTGAPDILRHIQNHAEAWEAAAASSCADQDGLRPMQGLRP